MKAALTWQRRRQGDFIPSALCLQFKLFTMSVRQGAAEAKRLHKMVCVCVCVFRKVLRLASRMKVADK